MEKIRPELAAVTIDMSDPQAAAQAKRMLKNVNYKSSPLTTA